MEGGRGGRLEETDMEREGEEEDYNEERKKACLCQDNIIHTQS